MRERLGGLVEEEADRLVASMAPAGRAELLTAFVLIGVPLSIAAAIRAAWSP